MPKGRDLWKFRGKFGEIDITQSSWVCYIMQTTAESKRWEQKKSKLISRLSRYCSLKLVKKVKGRDLWKFRGNFGEIDITQSSWVYYIMQTTAESKRWEQKKSKIISRLSRYCSLKLVKKVKNAQRSGPLEISGKFRGNFGEIDITQSSWVCYIMQTTAESKRWEQKKSKLISRLSRYCSLKLVKKVKGRDLWKFRGKFGEIDITQSSWVCYIMQTTAESKRWEQKKSKLISRLSRYCSLKLVKKVKGRDLWKFRGKFGEIDITQSSWVCYIMQTTAESKRWEQKKSKLISRLSRYCSLQLGKKVKGRDLWKFGATSGEIDITQSSWVCYIMQTTAESKRWEQKKSKLIGRLSRYCSLKLVKKVKNAQRSGPLEISGKFRGNFGEIDITQSSWVCYIMQTTAESKRWEQKKSKLIGRLSRYCSLKLVKKVKGRDLWKFR